MSIPTSNHGGARPGAGRKPKIQSESASVSDLLSALLTDSETITQVQNRLRENLPQLLEALLSLAQGATTKHERWVAAGTLTTGIGTNTRLLLPQLPPAQLVLVACDTYTHKPDTQSLLFLLESVLSHTSTFHEVPENPQPTPETTPPLYTANAPAANAPAANSPQNSSPEAEIEAASDLFNATPLPENDASNSAATLRQYPIPPRALPLTPTNQDPLPCPTKGFDLSHLSPELAKLLGIPTSKLLL